MKIVIQRVSYASCTVNQEKTGQIQQGFLLLVGVAEHDTKSIAEKLARKIVNLRVFSDENGKMNLNISAHGGQILSISQFTLYGDLRSGNRPSFTAAAHPTHAKEIYDYFNECLRKQGVVVEEGIFGADMKIELLNDGPVTFILEE